MRVEASAVLQLFFAFLLLLSISFFFFFSLLLLSLVCGICSLLAAVSRGSISAERKRRSGEESPVEEKTRNGLDAPEEGRQWQPCLLDNEDSYDLLNTRKKKRKKEKKKKNKEKKK